MKGFKYDKFKEELSSNDSWGSYSDLFMVLSFVFLMMYVVASLRSGTNSIQQRIETQKVARENEEMRAQMKAYDTLKDSALNKESEEEQEVYNQLMDKLSLLKDEAKNEKDNLRRMARENEQKEMALNKYQQIVRNIIDANLLAKNKLKVREEIIANKNTHIEDLKDDLKDKEQTIAQNNSEISKINRELNQNIARLTQAQKDSKITKEKAYAQIAQLKRKGQEQISKLNQENKAVEAQLKEITRSLSETSEKLVKTETKNQELSVELETTSEKLKDTIGDYESKIQHLRSAHSNKMAQEKAAFDKKIQSMNLSAAEKTKRLEAFRREVQQKNQALNGQISALQGEIADAQQKFNAKAAENSQLSQKLAASSEALSKAAGEHEAKMQALKNAHDKKMAGERAQFENKLNAANLSALDKAKQLSEFNRRAREKDEAVQRQIAGLKGELADAQEKANARAKLSKDIANALKNAGIEADVNANTGDVLISFGKDYFESGSSNLKPTMVDVLKKFVPKYAETLFKDPKIADKITSVEIVGFASPTYNGKYIDPQSLSPEDQKAAKYNLDLSFKRARSIFDYMFDTQKINYQNQRELLPLVKVTGRSFFAEGRVPAGAVPGMSQREFCLKFDCKQAQKVVIKFNMDDKK